MADEKRKTVNVHNGLGRPIKLHLHQVVADDGGGRPFFGRLLATPPGLPDMVELRPGANSGIDHDFFSKWREQNPGMALDITAQDEE